MREIESEAEDQVRWKVLVPVLCLRPRTNDRGYLLPDKELVNCLSPWDRFEVHGLSQGVYHRLCPDQLIHLFTGFVPLGISVHLQQIHGLPVEGIIIMSKLVEVMCYSYKINN